MNPLTQHASICSVPQERECFLTKDTRYGYRGAPIFLWGSSLQESCTLRPPHPDPNLTCKKTQKNVLCHDGLGCVHDEQQDEPPTVFQRVRHTFTGKFLPRLWRPPPPAVRKNSSRRKQFTTPIIVPPANLYPGTLLVSRTSPCPYHMPSQD